jgi:hypothetical protein
MLQGGRVLNSHVIFVVAIGLLFAIIAMSSLGLAVVRARGESASIEAANSSINQAFSSVLAAEQAGGNVTTLLAQLNSAGELLAEADNDYQSGNLNDVASNANNANLIANQVNNEAISLRNASISQSQTNFVSILFFSMDAVTVFVVVLLLVWRWFKRSYIKSLSEAKPEVNSQ